MDDLKTKMMTAVITAAISVSGTYLGAQSYYVDKLDANSREIGVLENKMQQAKKTISDLKHREEIISSQLASLQDQYNVLEKKYHKCTTAEGITKTEPSFDTQWHNATLSTGDNLQFKLSTSSLYLKLIRVTHRGPICKIIGCDNPYITDGFISKTDGSHAYLLRKGNMLRLQASSRTCDEGMLIEDLGDMEEIVIEPKGFDVEKQTAILKYKKTPF